MSVPSSVISAGESSEWEHEWIEHGAWTGANLQSLTWHQAGYTVNCELHVQVAPTPEDLDWLEDNGPLLRLESLRMPGASLSLRGEDFMRILLQFSAERLSVLDLGHVTATNLDFLEGLSQLNAVHSLDVSGVSDIRRSSRAAGPRVVVASWNHDA